MALAGRIRYSLHMHVRSAKGSVILIILVAIALFAGLVYAIMGNRGGSQGTMAREQAATQASKIVAYLSGLKNGTNLLVTGNRCRESLLDFGNTTWKTLANADTTASNGSAAVDGSCSLFNANGGGQMPLIFADAVASTYGTSPTTAVAKGHGKIGVAKVEQTGSALSELVAVIGGLDLEVCRQIQKQTGIADASTDSKLNADCFSMGTSTTDLSFSPSASWQLGNTGTLVGNKILTGTCNTSHSTNPVAATTEACFAAIVLMER